MQPIVMSLLGTTISTPVIMDYMQNPFQVSLACVLGTAAGTFSIQHSFDYTTVFSPTWNGTSNVTWFTNTGINAATGTISGNYAFPVAAIRANLSQAVATTTLTVVITQASNAP